MHSDELAWVYGNKETFRGILERKDKYKVFMAVLFRIIHICFVYHYLACA